MGAFFLNPKRCSAGTYEELIHRLIDTFAYGTKRVEPDSRNMPLSHVFFKKHPARHSHALSFAFQVFLFRTLIQPTPQTCKRHTRLFRLRHTLLFIKIVHSSFFVTSAGPCVHTVRGLQYLRLPSAAGVLTSAALLGVAVALPTLADCLGTTRVAWGRHGDENRGALSHWTGPPGASAH